MTTKRAIDTLIPNMVCNIHYRCRDIGYGVEEGSLVGYWSGEIDTWGKRTIRVVEHIENNTEQILGSEMYLFSNEIVSVEEGE